MVCCGKYVSNHAPKLRITPAETTLAAGRLGLSQQFRMCPSSPILLICPARNMSSIYICVCIFIYLYIYIYIELDFATMVALLGVEPGVWDCSRLEFSGHAC